MIEKIRVTITELARVAGVSRQTIYNAIRRGDLATNPVGSVDQDEAERWLCSRAEDPPAEQEERR